MSTSYFLQSGHLLKHTWHHYPYVIHMNPLTKIPPSTLTIDRCISTKWEEDINLLAIYLEAKNLIKNKPKEVKELMTDFMVSILERKPDKILEFAKEYFTSKEIKNDQDDG